jgi:hypothetical protein
LDTGFRNSKFQSLKLNSIHGFYPVKRKSRVKSMPRFYLSQVPSGVHSLKAVVHCLGGYVLPEGLTEGDVVRLLKFDHGYYNVECRDGRRFHVAGNCVEPVSAAQAT